MKIIHIAPLTLKKTVGLTYSIPNFVKAQNSIKNIDSKILVSINPKNRDEQYNYVGDFDKIELKNFLSEFDIAIFHSTYIFKHINLAKILRKLGIPYIIVPRGGFTKKSKNIKKIKKYLADLIIFNRFFKSPSAIHYLSNIEKENSVYKTKNDFVLPNGIFVSDVHNSKYNKNILNRNNIRIIYIGRIDIYIKGLDILIKAIKLIKEELSRNNVIIELYGPDNNNSVKKIKKMISKFNINEIVKINSAVYGKDKVEKLNAADFFIQTSRFEGLPMGVLEALSFGIPCILTPGTNLSSEVERINAGIEVLFEPESISKGIMKVIKNPSIYSKMRNNAVKLAEEYSWERIAKKSIKIYDNLIFQHK